MSLGGRSLGLEAGMQMLMHGLETVQIGWGGRKILESILYVILSLLLLF